MNNNLRPIYEIAAEIRKDWGPKGIYFGAKPYLDAMLSLKTCKDMYVLDDGYDIVARYLCNAQTHRGPVARATKKELNAHLKVK